MFLIGLAAFIGQAARFQTYLFLNLKAARPINKKAVPKIVTAYQYQIVAFYRVDKLFLGKEFFYLVFVYHLFFERVSAGLGTANSLDHLCIILRFCCLLRVFLDRGFSCFCHLYLLISYSLLVNRALLIINF